MIRQFHHRDFLPLEQCVEHRRRAKLTISLVIPAKNEEATIGAIVRCARQTCIERYALLDEIIVIDSCSTDATASVARNAGAAVYGVDELVPECPPHAGKGMAMWASQRKATGDIILFLDADIVDFNERFIYGLVAPLLTRPELCFVKAWYRRPFSSGDTVDIHGGGRVTEILVRPLLAAFYPFLARLYQPLSGEYAVRRQVLEQVPFSSGYGVDIGLILEIYRRFGIDCIAQVDVEVRNHRNRPVLELGAMSFAIIQTLLHNLHKDGKISVAGAPETLMVVPRQGAWETTRIEELELPAVKG
jgi:glucosyl-3-phosphoglycerate synthase